MTCGEGVAGNRGVMVDPTSPQAVLEVVRSLLSMFSAEGLELLRPNTSLQDRDNLNLQAVFVGQVAAMSRAPLSS